MEPNAHASENASPSSDARGGARALPDPSRTYCEHETLGFTNGKHPTSYWTRPTSCTCPSGRCCDNGVFGIDHDCQKQQNTEADAPPAPPWLVAAIDAYEDVASVGGDPWDPATSFWNGYVKAIAIVQGRSVDDVTTEVRAHVTGR